MKEKMPGNYSRLYRLIKKRTTKAGVIGLGRALGHRARTRVRERFSIERMLDSTEELLLWSFAGPDIGQGGCTGKGEGASGGRV